MATGAQDERLMVDVVAVRKALPADAVVYLSGPMTGLPDYNRAAFDAAADALAEWCRDVFSPAGLRHEAPKRAGRAWYMRRDLQRLVAAEHAERLITDVVLLEGWSASAGARLEAAVAQEIGLRVWQPDGAPLPAGAVDTRLAADVPAETADLPHADDIFSSPIIDVPAGQGAWRGSPASAPEQDGDVSVYCSSADGSHRLRNGAGLPPGYAATVREVEQLIAAHADDPTGLGEAAASMPLTTRPPVESGEPPPTWADLAAQLDALPYHGVRLLMEACQSHLNDAAQHIAADDELMEGCR